ncbi:hypothetical protein EFY87_07655 [Flexivirga caeni]|uniref:CoA transferase n=1 Tax=Flexivirga caeni TaxID=2294115 RepID=A0A3M9MCM6_9MICO|nr:hypothetical protein EFY87_07655 [Flexivirga caeni]
MARGPRRIWDGPLDVEGLAVASVAAAASAANSLAFYRDSAWQCFVSSGLVAASFGSIGRLRVDDEPVKPWGALSGFYRTRDGWIRLHANYPHHAAVLRSQLHATSREELAAAIRGREALELEQTLRAAGGIAGAVRTAQVWREHPHHVAAIADRPLISLGMPTGGRRPLETSASLPLQGIRVLDLTRVIAGPTAARFLGALGADVLRIDNPARPELLDQHLDTGFAKRTAELDFTTAQDLRRARELTTSADIVLSAYRPGALARFGLDAASLLSDHPHLVVVELSAWGDTGPWGGQRGFDSIVQAVSGIATTYADASGAPGALPVQALDHATGYLMATTAMRLLARRPHEGGASARLALARTGDWLLAHPAPELDPEFEFDGPDCPLWSATARSPYGTIEYVRPPAFANGVPLDFPSAPRRYGVDPPEWWIDDEPVTG